MGLRVFASRRHPDAVVMAPALTESGQTQSFQLPSTALSLLDACDLTVAVKSKPKRISQELRQKVFNLALEELKGPNGTIPKRSTPLRPLDVVPGGGDTSMNSASPMGDESENFGLLKNNTSCALPDNQENLPFVKSEELGNCLVKGNDNEVEQLEGEIPTLNVDELMRAIGTMDSADTGEFPAELASFAEEVICQFPDAVEELPEPVPDNRLSQANAKREEVKRRCCMLERQHSRLLRRIKKLEAREVAKSATAEVTSVLHHAYRMFEPETGPATPTRDLSQFMDQVHAAAHNPPSTIVRYRAGVRYFGSGSSEPPPSLDPIHGSVWPKISPAERDSINTVSSQLSTHLSFAESQFDSDATDSSSGGDSCDESINYNNHLRSFMPIKKRAYWRWQQDRGSVASRWTWLIGQIADLDSRMRQMNDHHRRYRAQVGQVTLADEESPLQSIPVPTPVPVPVNGYHGALPGGGRIKTVSPNGTNSSYDPTSPSKCARTRAYQGSSFRKRHIVRTENLHQVLPSGKVARPSSFRCFCIAPDSCILCTGRPDPTQPASWPEPLPTSLQERLAALEKSFHPVLSFPYDVPVEQHMAAVSRLREWQTRSNRPTYKSKYNKFGKSNASKGTIVARLKRDKPLGLEHKRKMHKHATALLSAKLLKKKLVAGQRKRRELKALREAGHATVPPLRIRKASKFSSFSCDSGDEDLYVAGTPVDYMRASPEPGSANASERGGEDVRRGRSRGDSFDINNIVIPYSMAASTRVEMLQYKEIPTPKWRVLDETTTCDMLATTGDCDSADEDVSEQAVTERHAKCEEAERRRFMSYIKLPVGARSRANRRTDSRAESSGANTPDPMSPMALDHADSPLTTPPATPQAIDESSSGPVLSTTTTAPASTTTVNLRRRTISSSRAVLREKLEKAAATTDQDRCLTPEPEDEIPPYEPRLYPLKADEVQRMEAVMPPEVPPSPAYGQPSGDGGSNEGRAADDASTEPVTTTTKTSTTSAKAADGEPAAFHCDTLPDSPSSSSTLSALEEVDDLEDPNDPEWQAPDDDDDDDYRCRSTRR